MKRSLELSFVFTVVGLINACGVSDRPAANLAQASFHAGKPRPSDAVEISGSDADKIHSALEKLGIVDTDHLIGATNLRVKNLRCDTDVSNPSRKVRCRYEAVNPETGAVESFAGIQGQSSDDLYMVLSKHGLSVPGGINPSYRAVAAKALTCSLPVVPRPVAHCVAEKL